MKKSPKFSPEVRERAVRMALERLPLQPASKIDELLPHRRQTPAP